MRKLFTLLFVAGLSLTSCKKDETVKAKDYTTYTVTANMNSEDGKMVPVLGPPPTYTPTGEMQVQYFYSVQYSLNINDKDKPFMGVVNSSKDYQDVVVPVDPNSELTEALPKNGDWQLMLTYYKTDAFHAASQSWYTMNLVGVLTNTENNIETAVITDDKFDTVSLEDANNAEFKNDVDNIGHAWQYYDRTEHKYKIVENNYYLVKIGKDEIYKLRFMDFYGDGKEKGEKGHITFQYELLK
jgi:hypothetical protein